MSSKILLVEDDSSMRDLLRFFLETHGYDVETCADGDTALTLYPAQKFGLIILDLMLPGLDGFAFCKATRGVRESQRTPLLVLTAKQELKDRYDAFELGANDYLTKPFDPMELLLRVRAFLRLTQEGEAGQADLVEVGAVTLMPQKFKAVVDDREVWLTKMETMLLQFLMTHEGDVFSADMLANTVFEKLKARGCTADAIHAHIRNIRGKLEPDPKSPSIVITVGKKGYAFCRN